MKLVSPALIRAIDRYATKELGISERELMRRSGDAVASAVRERVPAGAAVLILAGKGNNGGDGYAAALALAGDFSVTVCDVFGVGQTGEAGRYFLSEYQSGGGRVVLLSELGENFAVLRSAGCIVDAIFGTGFRGDVPAALLPLSGAIRETVGACKIAVDVPLGVDPENGEVSENAITVAATVSLAWIKTGVVSYPARAHVGEILCSDLGLPLGEIAAHFGVADEYVDLSFCAEHLPKREVNSHKGTFGKLLSITGCARYRGAADLTLAAALRGGCGSVCYLGAEELCRPLSVKYPEVIFHPAPPVSEWDEDRIERALALSDRFGAVLVGSGSGNTPALGALVRRLLSAGGAPLILDADALNALSEDPHSVRPLLKNAARPVIITPHPLEFSRLCGETVEYVQLHRIACAKAFAKETGCVVLLKGAATIVTDGERLLVNSAGTSALAKAGSGDVLAGFLASLVAMGTDPLLAAAIAAYAHAAAGERLSARYSSFGVTPSDLPAAIAAQLLDMQKAARGDQSDDTR